MLAAANMRDPVLHLIYHEFSAGSANYTYTISTDVFREHLKIACADRVPSHYSTAITFDDGHRSQFENALPLLAEFGASATFFITAGWVDQKTDYVSAAELRAIAAAGHRIGGHGLTHTLLTHCSASELRSELLDSKRILENAIGSPVSVISLPGGRYDRRVLDGCREAGYTQVFTSEPTIKIRENNGVQVIGRYNVLQTTTPAGLRELLDPASGALWRAQIRAKTKHAAQKVLGDRLYHLLWSFNARYDD